MPDKLKQSVPNLREGTYGHEFLDSSQGGNILGKISRSSDCAGEISLSTKLEYKIRPNRSANFALAMRGDCTHRIDHRCNF
jgi:hypothetical protein